MNSESKILKKIWENKEEAPLRLIAKQVGFSVDYTRYICNSLSAKEHLKPVRGKRGWYRVTAQGRKELERYGIARSKFLRHQNKVEKVTYYFPKKLSPKPSKGGSQSKPPESGSQKVKVKKVKEVETPEKIKKVDLTAEEKKFNLGRSIAKAVAYLKDL